MMKNEPSEMKSPNCDVPFHADSVIPLLLSKQRDTMQRQQGQAVLEAIPTPIPKKTTYSHCAVKFKFRKTPMSVLKMSSAARVRTRAFLAPHFSTLLPSMFMKMAMTNRTTMSIVPRQASWQLKGAVVRVLLRADHIVRRACVTAQLTSVRKQMRHRTDIKQMKPSQSMRENIDYSPYYIKHPNFAPTCINVGQYC